MSELDWPVQTSSRNDGKHRTHNRIFQLAVDAARTVTYVLRTGRRTTGGLCKLAEQSLAYHSGIGNPTPSVALRFVAGARLRRDRSSNSFRWGSVEKTRQSMSVSANRLDASRFSDLWANYVAAIRSRKMALLITDGMIRAYPRYHQRNHFCRSGDFGPCEWQQDEAGISLRDLQKLS